MVDVQSVGAGGGSIARVAGGRLLVGPQSAGAVPGPVCYGQGGTQPTVTDANVLLGRIDPARFAAGRRGLDVDAATAALAQLGAELGMDAVEAAAAIVDVIDAYMTDAVRCVLALAGADARSMSLVAFGGMGAVHATTQAAALGMQRVLVPLAASGFSAFGLLMADQVIDESRSYLSPWKEVDLRELTAAAGQLDRSATAELRDAGVPDERIDREWYVNMVFPGQTFDVSVPIERRAGEPISQDALIDAVEEFHRRNEAARLIESRAEEPLVRGMRLVAIGRTAHPDLAPPAAPEVEPARGTRLVHMGGEWVEADVVDVASLTSGSAPVVGPAVIEVPFSSLILRPGDIASAVESGDILVELGR
jgi:N-methylhydantoinase A